MRDQSNAMGRSYPAPVIVRIGLPRRTGYTAAQEIGLFPVPVAEASRRREAFRCAAPAPWQSHIARMAAARWAEAHAHSRSGCRPLVSRLAVRHVRNDDVLVG